LFRRYGSFASHEAWAMYERELVEHGDKVDPRVAHRILEYADRPAKDYIKLTLAMRELRQRFWTELAGVDAILAPTLPILPPRIADLGEDEEYYRVNALLLRNTAPFNMLGCPAASVPCAATNTGLSVGFMVVTRPGEEELALGIGRQVQRESAGQSATYRQRTSATSAGVVTPSAVTSHAILASTRPSPLGCRSTTRPVSLTDEPDGRGEGNRTLSIP